VPINPGGNSTRNLEQYSIALLARTVERGRRDVKEIGLLDIALTA